jgi:4'-phosphopantetheinyl transferase EntD
VVDEPECAGPDPAALARVLRELAPDDAFCAVEPVGSLAGLWPVEAREVGRAVPARCAQFAAGRRAARAALRALGEPEVAIERGSRGEPRWPGGVVGSISHTDSVAAAVVARSGRSRSVGLDLERVGALTPALWPVVFRPGERRALGDDLVGATVAFSAKEAAYKALFAMTGADLDYLQAEVEVRDGERVRVVPDGGEPVIDVVWRRLDDLVVTLARIAR